MGFIEGCKALEGSYGGLGWSKFNGSVRGFWCLYVLRASLCEGGLWLI